MDFSCTAAISAFITVVVPLDHDSKMWFFVEPLTRNVWITFLACIPVYLLTMALANYLFSGWADWGKLSSFVLRNALCEHYTLPTYKNAYQKIFIMTWVSMSMLMVYAYSCNLTAMLAKPQLQAPIRSFEDLLSRNDIQLVIEKGYIIENILSAAPPGSVLRRLLERSTIMPNMSPQEKGIYGCYAAKLKQGFASFCDVAEIMAMTAYNYGATGKCDNYLLVDRINQPVMSPLAFQVDLTLIALGVYSVHPFSCSPNSNMLFQKGSTFVEDFNNLIRDSHESGIELTKEKLLRYIPNATKCDTWSDVKASHMEEQHSLVVNLDDITGMMVLLTSGLCGGLIILMAEHVTKSLQISVNVKKNDNRPR